MIYKNYFAILLVLGSFLAGFCTSLIIGEDRAIDYSVFYYPQLQGWAEGKSILYDMNISVHNPPWMLWLFRPFLSFSYAWQVAFLRGFTFAVIVYGLWFVSRNLAKPIQIITFALGIFNFFTLNLFLSGQIDALPLLGLIIALQTRSWFGKGVGYTLLAIKPPNFWIFAAFIFILEIKNKGWLQAAKGLIVPSIVTVLSFGVHGNWLTRWYTNFTTASPHTHPKTTLWRAAEHLQIASFLVVIVVLIVLLIAFYTFLRTKNEQQQLILVLVTTYTVTIYNLSYQLVVLMIFVLPFILNLRLRMGLFLYLFSYIGLIRAGFATPEDPYAPLALFWLDMIWVVAMFGAVVWLILEKSGVAEKEHPVLTKA
jgi:hypothetical protein